MPAETRNGIQCKQRSETELNKYGTDKKEYNIVCYSKILSHFVPIKLSK